jgi:DNA helicase-2/ATP-dependent DNA helicase PcrA
MARIYHLQSPPRSTSGIDFAAELNPEQLAAVTCEKGPSLIIAGAGSGKTRTLTYRVAWLLQQGVLPQSILLLTFTNKAAREMLERVERLLPGVGEGVWGGTFHSLGNRLLRRHAEEAGYRPGFTILDREDQEDLIEAVVAREGLRGSDKNFPKASVLADLFSLAVNTCQPIEKVIQTKYRYFYRLLPDLEKLAGLYLGRKRETNSLDFDDLLAQPLALLRNNNALREKYQRQFQHVLVDEYQDTNLLQAHLVDILAGGSKSLTVVGDDAQSIYSWRGADCANILDFPKHHPGTQIFKIETNYRSVPEVLALANAAIAGNTRQFAKNLRAVRTGGISRPVRVNLPTNNQQASFVAQRVLELVEEGIGLEEMAVLYRAHFHSMELQLELTKRGIPFTLTSGLRFFEQAHIKDVAACMRFVVNPRDEISFKRCVRLFPGIGGQSAERLWQKTAPLLTDPIDFSRLHSIDKVPGKAANSWKQWVHTLEECAPGGIPLEPAAMLPCILEAYYLDYLINRYPNADARREDLETLSGYARGFTSTEEFLAQLALLNAVDTSGTDGLRNQSESDSSSKLTLSSIHQAKGLEWRVVFLIWLADGMFPTQRSVENDDALEEERRLFYVGVTRCEDDLYLTWPEVRLNASYGDAFQRPSRFLQELPKDVVEVWEINQVEESISRWDDHSSQLDEETENEPF